MFDLSKVSRVSMAPFSKLSTFLLAYQCLSFEISTTLAAQCKALVQVVDDGRDGYYKSAVICEEFGDDGRSFDEVFSQIKALTSIPPSVEEIEIWTKGNFTINETKLPLLPKLKWLRFRRYVTQDQPITLRLTSNLFKKMPRLQTLNIWGFYDLENSTLEAINEFSNQITNLDICGGSPTKQIFELVANFSNLTDIRLCCNEFENEQFPSTIFQKSAQTLHSVRVENCQIGKLSSDTFRWTAGLTYLRLESNNITTIEEGAFDDQINLRILNLEGNKIKTLPQGLFNKTKQLEYENVALTGSNIENLSQGNFSCCE